VLLVFPYVCFFSCVSFVGTCFSILLVCTFVFVVLNIRSFLLCCLYVCFCCVVCTFVFVVLFVRLFWLCCMYVFVCFCYAIYLLPWVKLVFFSEHFYIYAVFSVCLGHSFRILHILVGYFIG